MNIEKLTERLREAAERLKSAWSKLFATLYPSRSETKSPKIEPLTTQRVVEAQATASSA